MGTMSKEQMTEEEALQRFLLDIDCLDELLPWTGKFNIFDVLKISRTEIRHSNTLSWLLDPSENHGLGDTFLKSIFQWLVENDSENRYEVFNVLLMDYYSFVVFREWKNIDILLVSSDEKCVMAIENKVGSHEHSNQLNRYREILEKEYPDYTRLFVYLTPDGEEPSDVSNWDVMSYSDVVDILEAVYKRTELQDDAALMIRNYIDVIRRDIVEDQELIEICNKIYHKHQKALDLIFENRTDGINTIGQSVSNAIKNNGSVIPGDLSKKRYTVFYTDRMSDYLGTMDENSSWGDSYSYRYWISFRRDDRIIGYFELGGNNLTPEVSEKHQRIIDILKPNDGRRDEYKYKRVYKTKSISFHDGDEEEEITKKVDSIIKELIGMENDLFKKLQ